MRKRQRGTITDLLVMVVCFLVLATIALLTARRACQASVIADCASHLHKISQAMFLYANDNHQTFPRTAWMPGMRPTQYTAASAISSFGPGGPEANDVSAAMFLLVKYGNAAPDTFICPAAAKIPTSITGSNFPDEANLGYSMANPYPDRAVQYKWSSIVPSTFVLFADLNPGYNSDSKFCANIPRDPGDTDHLRAGNSPNHGGDGQNVLYADGHVEWRTTPFAGDKNDNIYTVSDVSEGSHGPYNYTNRTANAGSPAYPLDDVLLPPSLVVVSGAAGLDTATPAFRSSMPILWIVIGIVIAAGLIIAGVFVQKRRSSTR